MSDTVFAKGRETFAAAFGSDSADFITSVDAMAPGLGRMIVETEFGDAYNRPGLDLKTRELVILASCATLGSIGLGAVKMHIPAALAAGATREEITEVFVQLAFAAGFPTSLGALQCAQSTFAELDQQKAA